ncbi:hypothetical protein Salat_0662400 [Sesamum alatum]|uniref:Uncharacterized protein n=1 Tax=Sesamum alatum TaxID=300844 RepID=A0AAE1YRN0_9LAMI|nr:hypothetical protein Salat_0662400 [Sesamum alatum]
MFANDTATLAQKTDDQETHHPTAKTTVCDNTPEDKDEFNYDDPLLAELLDKNWDAESVTPKKVRQESTEVLAITEGNTKQPEKKWDRTQRIGNCPETKSGTMLRDNTTTDTTLTKGESSKRNNGNRLSEYGTEMIVNKKDLSSLAQPRKEKENLRENPIDSSATESPSEYSSKEEAGTSTANKQ